MRLSFALFVASTSLASALVVACGSRSNLEDYDSPTGDAGPGDRSMSTDAPHPKDVHAQPDTADAYNYVPKGKVCTRDPDASAPPVFFPDMDASFDAAHPPAPQVVNVGGTSTIALPVLTGISFAEDTLNDEEEDFLNSVGCTDYWNTVASPYGVGPAIGGKHVRVTEAAPASITDDEIQVWLVDKLAKDPSFPTPDANTLLVIFYPESTTISLQGQQSCQTFGGYHNSFNYLGRDVPYAVIPHCPFFDGLNGINGITGATSHELVEAVSDPAPLSKPAYALPEADGVAFALAGGGELGDMCEFKQDAFFVPTSYPFFVQRTWNNKSAFQLDDPCQPAAAGPFFAAAPRFTTTVSFDFGAGPQTGKGVKLAVGQQATIDIVAFANGSVPAWKISAHDAAQFQGGPAELSLSLDTNMVQDGDVAHLTVKRVGSAGGGASAFGIVSSGSGKQAYWWGLVTE